MRKAKNKKLTVKDENLYSQGEEANCHGGEAMSQGAEDDSLGI